MYNTYILNHVVRNIEKGKSGAHVYELDNNRIAKHILRQEIKNDSIWETYKHESMLYSYYSESEYSFLPKIYTNLCNDDEILIIMEKYRSIQHRELNQQLLGKILEVLIRIHTMKIPAFLPCSPDSPTFYDEAVMAECMEGWQSVLEEHKDTFDYNALQTLHGCINELNQHFYNPKKYFLHGDFHFENVLLDAQEDVIICDWQSCGTGNLSVDISFFLSRLSADGYQISSSDVIETYCELAKDTGLSVNPEEIDIQIRLANLNVSFRFWHMYLHGCTEESVANIYVKMIEDMKVLRNALKE